MKNIFYWDYSKWRRDRDFCVRGPPLRGGGGCYGWRKLTTDDSFSRHVSSKTRAVRSAGRQDKRLVHTETIRCATLTPFHKPEKKMVRLSQQQANGTFFGWYQTFQAPKPRSNAERRKLPRCCKLTGVLVFACQRKLP